MPVRLHIDRDLSFWEMADDTLDVLRFLLPNLPASLLTTTNENGSPPLHWAILNNHVSIVQLLVDLPEEQGGGLPLLKVSSLLGRSASAPVRNKADPSTSKRTSQSAMHSQKPSSQAKVKRKWQDGSRGIYIK